MEIPSSCRNKDLFEKAKNKLLESTDKEFLSRERDTYSALLAQINGEIAAIKQLITLIETANEYNKSLCEHTNRLTKNRVQVVIPHPVSLLIILNKSDQREAEEELQFLKEAYIKCNTLYRAAAFRLRKLE